MSLVLSGSDRLQRMLVLAITMGFLPAVLHLTCK